MHHQVIGSGSPGPATSSATAAPDWSIRGGSLRGTSSHIKPRPSSFLVHPIHQTTIKELDQHPFAPLGITYKAFAHIYPQSSPSCPPGNRPG
jgi:hypothetical protein